MEQPNPNFEYKPVRKNLIYKFDKDGMFRIGGLRRTDFIMSPEQYILILEDMERGKNFIFNNRRHATCEALHRDPIVASLADNGLISDSRFYQLFIQTLIPAEGATNEQIIRRRNGIRVGTPINPTLFSQRYNLPVPSAAERLWREYNEQRQRANNLNAINDEYNRIRRNIWHPDHVEGREGVKEISETPFFNRCQPVPPVVNKGLAGLFENAQIPTTPLGADGTPRYQNLLNQVRRGEQRSVGETESDTESDFGSKRPKI